MCLLLAYCLGTENREQRTENREQRTCQTQRRGIVSHAEKELYFLTASRVGMTVLLNRLEPKAKSWWIPLCQVLGCFRVQLFRRGLTPVDAEQCRGRLLGSSLRTKSYCYRDSHNGFTSRSCKHNTAANTVQRTVQSAGHPSGYTHVQLVAYLLLLDL